MVIKIVDTWNIFYNYYFDMNDEVFCSTYRKIERWQPSLLNNVESGGGFLHSAII